MRAWRSLGLCLALGSAASAGAEQRARPMLASPSVVLVHGGAFDMGSDAEDVAYAVALCNASASDVAFCRPESFADEQPRHRVYVSAFRVDRLEVSLGDYQRCVEDNRCAPARVASGDARLALPEQPVTGVTAAEAARYCEWLGGRLPTEAEWERAARGTGHRQFPWGREWNSRVANHGLAGDRPASQDGYEYLAPVDAFPDGKSPYGLLNMAGNVWELTADRYARDGYAKSEAVDPRGSAEGDEIVIRGGSWRTPAYALRTAQRATIKVDESRPDVGFRCVH